MLSLLEATSLNLIEVPPNVQGILVMEDVQASFNEDRYYISSREKVILDIITKMNRAASKLAEKKVNYVNSTMLYGESGTGKTTFGRYVAYRLGLPFAYLNFSHVLDSYLGGSQKIFRLFTVFFIVDAPVKVLVKGLSMREHIDRLNVTEVAPSIRLEDDKYTLRKPSLSNVYDGQGGTYQVNGEYLTLTPSDGNGPLEFKIDKDKIIYDEEMSDTNELITEYAIADGDEFCFIDN